MSAKVSVIVAAYNVGSYLARCIDSLLKQTYDDIEIIIVDDGSTDKTAEICRRYAESDKRIRIIRQENRGLSSARNVGIKKATGESLVFIDGDDYVDERMIEVLHAHMEGVDVAICGYTIMPEGKLDVPGMGVISGREATIRLLTKQENIMIVTWNKMYRRELFGDIKFPVGRKNEDSLTTYKVLSRARRISLIDKSLYYYVKREGSIMDTMHLAERLKMKRQAAEEAREYFRNDDKLSQAAEVAELLAVFSYLDNMIGERIDGDDKEFFGWIKENKGRLISNAMVGGKLRSYIHMATWCNGVPYRLFRKIKN